LGRTEKGVQMNLKSIFKGLTGTWDFSRKGRQRRSLRCAQLTEQGILVRLVVWLTIISVLVLQLVQKELSPWVGGTYPNNVYQSDLLSLDTSLESKVTKGGNGSEQRRQIQNGGREAFNSLVGPSEESVFFSKGSF
jgi:hypothetical protein